MKNLLKLRLKQAIIFEDARRLRNGDKTINNLRRLAVELSEKYPNDYEDADVLYIILWRSCNYGYRENHHLLSNYRKSMIDHLCKVLNTNEDEILIDRVL